MPGADGRRRRLGDRGGGLLRRPGAASATEAAASAASPVARPVSSLTGLRGRRGGLGGLLVRGLRRPAADLEDVAELVEGRRADALHPAQRVLERAEVGDPAAVLVARLQDGVGDQRPEPGALDELLAGGLVQVDLRHGIAPVSCRSAPLCAAEGLLQRNMPARGWFRAAKPGRQTCPDPRLHPHLP